MRKNTISCMAGCIILCVVGTSGATPIKSYTPVLTGVPIDFEGYIEGTPISNQYAGITFGQHIGTVPMIDVYPWKTAYGSSSGSAVLIASQTGGAPIWANAGIRMYFAEPVAAVQAFFSDTVPLGDYPIRAYDGANTLLESFVVSAGEILPPGYTGVGDAYNWPPPGTYPLPGLYVGFTRPTADIAWVQIGPSTAWGDCYAIDDVQFARITAPEEPPAPEVIPAPGAMLLGTLGAGFVGWLRRRRTL
jgi:hypothetical protein